MDAVSEPFSLKVHKKGKAIVFEGEFEYPFDFILRELLN